RVSWSFSWLCGWLDWRRRTRLKPGPHQTVLLQIRVKDRLPCCVELLAPQEHSNVANLGCNFLSPGRTFFELQGRPEVRKGLGEIMKAQQNNADRLSELCLLRHLEGHGGVLRRRFLFPGVLLGTQHLRLAAGVAGGNLANALVAQDLAEGGERELVGVQGSRGVEQRSTGIVPRGCVRQRIGEDLDYLARITGVLRGNDARLIEKGLIRGSGSNALGVTSEKIQFPAAKFRGVARAGESQHGFDTLTVRILRGDSDFYQGVLRATRIRACCDLRFGQPHAEDWVPRSGFDEGIEKRNGLRVVPGFFEQRRGRIHVLIRIANDRDQTAEQFDGPRGVAGGDANLRKAQKVCGDQFVLVELAREYKLQNFARRLFIPGFRELSRG